MWEEISGHQQNKEFLHKLLAGDKKTSPLLFHGPEGVGKKLLAKAFAKELMCLSQASPCRGCPSCRALAANAHPDFLLVEQEAPGKDIVIEQMKEVARQAAFAPHLSAYRVCVIDAADYMNPTAANSLLKLLEEPPANWLFILVAASEARLLATIRSRVISLRFDVLPNRAVADKLRLGGATAAEAEALASLADGSLANALALQAAQTIDVRDRMLEFMENLPAARSLQLVAAYPWPEKTAAGDGQIMLKMLLYLLRDGLFCSEKLSRHVYNTDVVQRVEKCFVRWSTKKIKIMIRLVQDSLKGLAANAPGKVVWEALVVNMNKTLKEE